MFPLLPAAMIILPLALTVTGNAEPAAPATPVEHVTTGAAFHSAGLDITVEHPTHPRDDITSFDVTVTNTSDDYQHISSDQFFVTDQDGTVYRGDIYKANLRGTLAPGETLRGAVIIEHDTATASLGYEGPQSQFVIHPN